MYFRFPVFIFIWILTAAGIYAQTGEGFRLGEASQVVIGTGDLEASVGFYEKPGFRLIARDDSPNPWARGTKFADLMPVEYRDAGMYTNPGTGGNESNHVLKTPEGQSIFLFSF